MLKEECFLRNFSILDLCCRVMYQSSDSGEWFRERVVSMKSRWMLKCFFSMYSDLVVGDLQHCLVF